jgi:very-short-patch-repair endonuclease
LESYNSNLHKNAYAKLYEYAKELRQHATDAEQLLWDQIKNRKLAGLKFRRQHAISKFIADFYCHEKKLVVEIDGSVHELAEVKEKDDRKEDWFKELGLKTIRFSNKQVLCEMDFVLETIKNYSI